MTDNPHLQLFYLPDHIITDMHVMQEYRPTWTDYVYRLYRGSVRIATFSGDYWGPITPDTFLSTILLSTATRPGLDQFRKDIRIGNSLRNVTEM